MSGTYNFPLDTRPSPRHIRDASNDAGLLGSKMMKLGTETGSLVNHLYAGTSEQPIPAIGMGATILAWTDRYAGTIIDIGPDGSFTVREDIATRIDRNGMSDAQVYRYEPDQDGRLFQFQPVKRGNAKGQIREGGRKDGYRVLIGERRKYHDYSF